MCFCGLHFFFEQYRRKCWFNMLCIPLYINQFRTFNDLTLSEHIGKQWTGLYLISCVTGTRTYRFDYNIKTVLNCAQFHFVLSLLFDNIKMKVCLIAILLFAGKVCKIKSCFVSFLTEPTTYFSVAAIHACRFAKPLTCPEGQYFDTVQCRCTCFRLANCLPGYAFDKKTCECFGPIID